MTTTRQATPNQDEEEKIHTRPNPCTSLMNYATTAVYACLKRSNFFGPAITLCKADGSGLAEQIEYSHQQALKNKSGFHKFRIGPKQAVYLRDPNHFHEIYLKKYNRPNQEFSRQKGAASYDKSGLYTKLFGQDNILVLPTEDEKYIEQRDLLNQQLMGQDNLNKNAPAMLRIINRHLDRIEDGRIDNLIHFLNHLIIDLVIEIQLGITDLSLDEKQFFIDLADRATPYLPNMANMLWSMLGVKTEFDALIKEGREKITEVLNRNAETVANSESLLKRWSDKIDYVEPVSVFALVLFASYKSTTEAMLFTLMLLGDDQHTEIKQRLQAEINGILDNEPCSKEAIDKMHYLDCTVRESLRLYPPFPIFKDVLSEDVVLSGERFKKGTYFFLSPYRYHAQTIFGPDASEFNPKPGLSEVGGKSNFVTFGFPPRTCPGRLDSMLKIKLLVATILQRGDIELVNKDQHHPFKTTERFSLQPNEGKITLALPPREPQKSITLTL